MIYVLLWHVASINLTPNLATRSQEMQIIKQNNTTVFMFWPKKDKINSFYSFVPAEEDTVFVWASENKCFFTSLVASVLTVVEVESLVFVSHSVWPTHKKKKLKDFINKIKFIYLNQKYLESLEKHSYHPLVS